MNKKTSHLIGLALGLTAASAVAEGGDNYGLPPELTLGKPGPFTQAYLDEVAFPMTRESLQATWWDHGTGIAFVSGVALMR